MPGCSGSRPTAREREERECLNDSGSENRSTQANRSCAVQGLLSLRHGTREDSQCGAQCKSEPALPDENAQSWHHGGNERHPLDPEPKQGRKSRDCTERT